MKIGDKVKIARKEKGMSQNELAGKLGVTQQTVAQYENQMNCLKLDTIKKIASALDVDYIELLEEGTLLIDEYQPKHAKEGIEHPSHYNNEGGMECWDEMELIFGTEATMWFCLLSAWKYRYRMNDKDTPEKNMRKSNECIKKYKQLKEKLEK